MLLDTWGTLLEKKGVNGLFAGLEQGKDHERGNKQEVLLMGAKLGSRNLVAKLRSW